MACPNGVFLLRALPPTTAEALPEGGCKALLENLLKEADLLLHLGEAPSVVYRLAENCLVAADAAWDEGLRRLQVSMSLPVSRRSGVLPSSSAAAFRVSATLLDDSTGFRVTEEALLAQQLPGAVVTVEPLVAWQLPRVSLVLKARLTAREGSPAAQLFHLHFLMAAGDVGVTATIECEAFRPLQPGETAAGPRQQLLRLVEAAARRVLEGPALATQEEMDAAAAAMRAALEVQAAPLFSTSFVPDVALSRTRTEGERVRLPSGGYTVVPRYALTPGPRLSGYMGVLGAYGVGCDFLPWSRAKDGVFL